MYVIRPISGVLNKLLPFLLVLLIEMNGKMVVLLVSSISLTASCYTYEEYPSQRWQLNHVNSRSFTHISETIQITSYFSFKMLLHDLPEVS